MFSRIFFAGFLLLAPALARADLTWESTTVSTSAAPNKAPARAEFVFTNTGKYPVKVLGTKTSCGCTAAIADEKVFAPGEKGHIRVSFKTLNRHGLYQEAIALYTDDPAGREIELKLLVMVKDALNLDPEFLFWGRDEALSPKSIRVTVTEGYTVQGLELGGKYPDLDVRLQTVKPGAEYEVVVTPKKTRVKGTITVAPVIGGHAQSATPAQVRVT